MTANAHVEPSAPVQRAWGNMPKGSLPKAFPLCALLPRSLSKRGLSSSQCCLRAVLHPPHQRLWPLRLLLLVQILAPMGVGVEVDVEVNVEAEAATRMVAAVVTGSAVVTTGSHA